ncbi:MAG: hypothetical protein WC449_05690 [Candidatus Paceibacterota bacterium]
MRVETYTSLTMLAVIALLVFGEHNAKANGYVMITDNHDYMISPDMASYMTKQGHGKVFELEDVE